MARHEWVTGAEYILLEEIMFGQRDDFLGENSHLEQVLMVDLNLIFHMVGQMLRHHLTSTLQIPTFYE
jgi:hypothetical protein